MTKTGKNRKIDELSQSLGRRRSPSLVSTTGGLPRVVVFKSVKKLRSREYKLNKKMDLTSLPFSPEEKGELNEKKEETEKELKVGAGLESPLTATTSFEGRFPTSPTPAKEEVLSCSGNSNQDIFILH